MSEPRRDQYGRYLVVPPGGGKPRGYTRATTVAKTLDDGGGLTPWKATATVVGALRRPGLSAQWQALIAQYPNPWYDAPESKAECKRLVEECAQAGGSSDRAEIGTALHALIAMGNVDALTLLPAETRADIDAYRSTLDAAGVVLDATMIERICVLDELQIAGTSDNLRVTLPSYGDVVADLKTGTDLTYSWQSIAVQLAIYAHCDAIYDQGAAVDGSLDVRSAMPTLNRDVGLIMHVPAGEARCVLYLVDLVAGWEAVQHSMWARDWRKRKAIARPLEIAVGTSPPRGAAGEVTAQNPTALVSAPAAPPPFDAPAHEHSFVDNRCSCGATVGNYGRIMPPTFDPTGVSSPASVESTPFDAAAAVVESFGAIVDESPAIEPAETGWSFEGGAASAAALTALRTSYGKLVGASRAWVVRLGDEAKRGGYSFHMKGADGRESIRRFEIMRGLVAFARANESTFVERDADDVIRAIVVSVLGDHVESLTVGAAAGQLDAAGATLFAQRVHEFMTTSVPGRMSDSGYLRLSFAA